MARRIGTYFKNAVSALCIALVSVQPVLAQQIIADTNGPQVIDTANGLPMVMINTPDANGVSHNTYTAFGVGPGGAILNNVDTNTATTQLGGIVQGNSNLSGGAAGVILNEVTSTNTSVLNGFLEVGGQRADVIVANPNGITCDGCGFINTSRLTITTGTPSFEGEQFTGFSVDGGAVAIGAGGLDASDTTTFDLLSRQITVGGVVSGQRIRIVAGRNDVLYATGEITEKAADGSIAPSLAIDSTALGGMFANAITITSTEDGVGVRAPRDMAANAGSMTITADGRLVVNNASASQSVTVRSTEQVAVQGNVAAQEVDVTSAEDLVLEANARLVADSTAILTTGGDLNVGANGEITATRFDLDIAGVFRIGNGADVTSVETLDVDADSLINMGTLAATDGALIVTTSLDLTNEGLMFGDTGLTLSNDADITNSGGTIISNTGIVIGGDGNARTNAFTNRFGGVVETISGNISIAAVTFGNLRDAPELAEGVSTDGDQGNADCERDTCYDEIRETDQIIYDHDPSRIISAGHVTITADDATNAFSSVSAFGNITITADTLINVGQNYYRNEGGVATFIGADFGVIEAGGNLNLTNITGYIQNGAQTALTNDRTGSSDADLTTISIDSIGNPDLLVTNRDPDAEFLVETREEFVDLDQFVSSDYFLQAIAYDPELRRFGDAYAEALFIRKQLQELLGQLILTTGIDERAQIEAMYNNAIDALENLDLTPGVALTPDQIGALTSDIIWMEETVIDGERVLAPKVYLANPEIRFAGLSGAMITGRNVDVRTRNFDNSGNIRATDSLSIAVSETFRSTGGTVSAENIAVIGNNIEIITSAQTLMTERGQQVRLPALRTSGWTDSEDVALPAATFAAGSTIVLTARDAITTAGAQIAAGDNITLLAGGDITIGALRLASATGNRSGSNRNFVERVDHLTTSLTAGGDILLLSSGNVAGQNNIMLEGARLTAGGNVGMIAQDGDLLLAAVQDFYFRDYRRKKSGAFGFNTKIREQMTTRITNQVVQIAGASITGVADTNIYVEGSRFTIPGMANSDLAPGQLAMVSVNGSSVFDAPFDLFAETSYRNNSTLWGLVSNSTTSNSAHSIARSVFAETAGDIALNSGGDLTLTAVDFNAGGQFVTQVSGTTYLLAAINQNYSFTQTHRDNGIIMTDTTVEDINESVTFNRIAAAGGVNLDPTSQIVLAGVRDPLFDSTHPAAWASMADNGRSNLANAWLGTGAEASADDSDSADNSHWREGGEWSEKGTLLVRQVALPTSVDGAEYAYLDGVLARDSTINDPIELVNYHFYDRQQALNPAFKALLTIAVTQGVGGLEFLQLGTNLGLSGSMATAVNAATSSFAATLTVETTAGLVSGNLDMGQIVGTASFSALSAGLTSGINLDTFGASFEGVDWANTSAFQAAGLGFGKNLTIARLVEAGIDATVTAGLSSAVYDTDFLDSFAASMRSGAINLTMADLQSGIGDGVKARRYAEGDLSHAALHGLVGCAAGEALGGNCASGFAAGVAQSVYAGMLDGTGPDKSDTEAHNAWRAQVANQAELIGAGVGYLTSGGLAANVSNGGSIAQSGAVNNYLDHVEAADSERAREELAHCNASTDCADVVISELEATIRSLETLDQERNAQLRKACADNPTGDACVTHITAALIAAEFYQDPLSVDGLLPFSLDGISFQELEMRLRNGMEGHPREGFVEAVYAHRESTIAVLAEVFPSVVHTQNELADYNAKLAIATVAGGTAVLAARSLLTACVSNPTCVANLTAVEVAGTTTDLVACANGDGLACGAALVPVVTTGGLGDDALDAAAGFRRADGHIDEVFEGTDYSRDAYYAYAERKIAAGETPLSPDDYLQRRQQLDQNRFDGTRRQEQYRQEMADIYGEENVLTERYLRNAEGEVVRDPVTGEGRRLDCVVVNGQCGYAAEVTSPTASKDRQIEKEINIRDAGGTFVVNPNTGELIEVGNTSDVIRLD